MDENKIIEHIVSGNQIAFRQLYNNYHQMVFSVILGFVHSKENAEDILQDVFVDVYYGIGSFKGNSKLSSWICQIAVHKSLNFLRNNKKRLREQSIDDNDNTETFNLKKKHANNITPQQEMERKESKSMLEQAVNILPENQRTAFILCKYNDMSYAEIAETMQISISSVESLLFRAKKGLQKKLVHFYKKD